MFAEAPPDLCVGSFIARWGTAPIEAGDRRAWEVTANSASIISKALATLGSDFRIEAEVAVHVSAIIEPGAIVKGPAIIGAACFVAANAYLRGGVFLDESCTIGPACELKSSLMFRGSKLAHLNFVGDSILGENVNVEAGAMIANYRNELEDKAIRIQYRETIVETAVEKFGALIGDHSRVGANAVLAPGAILDAGTRIGRLSLIDMRPCS